jgi:hypothetical protein
MIGVIALVAIVVLIYVWGGLEGRYYVVHCGVWGYRKGTSAADSGGVPRSVTFVDLVVKRRRGVCAEQSAVQWAATEHGGSIPPDLDSDPRRAYDPVPLGNDSGCVFMVHSVSSKRFLFRHAAVDHAIRCAHDARAYLDAMAIRLSCAYDIQYRSQLSSPGA